MTSHKFRQELKQEAERWREEGLISQDFWLTLAQRYQLNNLSSEDSGDRFTAIIITLGCILVGLAVITFVAANWQVWPKLVKVLILLSTFLATKVSGFLVWQKSNINWRSRLGQGLLIAGSLILGANIGLMSQLFHQTGEVYQLFLAWGAAVSLMAYGLRLASLGMISIILFGIGYFNILGLNILGETNFVINFFSLIVGGVFIPLSYRCRSSWLFFLSSCLMTTVFTVDCFQRIEQFPTYLQGVIMAIALTLPVSWLWSYQDQPKIFTLNTSISFSDLSRKLAIFYLSILLYASSFNWWPHINFRESQEIPNLLFSNYSLVFTITILALMAIYWWWCLGKSERSEAIWRLDKFDTYVAISIKVIGILYLVNFGFIQLGTISTVIVNCLLFAMAIILIRYSLKIVYRLGYWSGILLLALQVTSRMLEFNTDLLFKSTILLICGLVIVCSGIWFEKNKSHSSIKSN